MAKRPVFIVSIEDNSLIKEREIEFEYHTGFAAVQKQKSIKNLHKEVLKDDSLNVLEVSTKSEIELGNKLSAFNLSFKTNEGKKVYLESIFQGSKIFHKNDGPFIDLYFKPPIEAKQDSRIDRTKTITGFKYDNIFWNPEPKTAFYDWLYLNALNQNVQNSNDSIYEDILNYNAFTDIEFNPKKSINCQARSCALFVSLTNRGMLQDALLNKDSFLEIISIDNFYSINSQTSLFEN